MDKKRLGVMVIFADDGEIESATLYLAKSVADMVTDLCVIINGRLEKSSFKALKCITSKIFVRKNEGYDSGAFKYALEQALGWNEVYKYEELILINDSCFGPIYSFEKMFCTMECRKCDFWGITDQPEIKRGRFSDVLLPYHIQSYFLVIRERMLKSQEFVDFWKYIKLSNTYELVVDNFELAFTKYFIDHGYKPDSYIDGREFCESVEERQAYVFFDSFRLMKKYKSPLLKKKVFLFSEQEILSANAGETARKTLEYIEKETEYNIDLIWEFLIKRSDLYELRSVLHLEYICSKSILQCEQTLEKPVGIIVCAYSKEMEIQCRAYVKKLGKNFHLHVILRNRENEELKIFLKKIVENYEYICVICEEEKLYDECARSRYVDALLENAIGSYIYVCNVLRVFDKNSRLGLLALPKPFIPEFFVGQFKNDLKNGFWARSVSLQGATDDIACLIKQNGYYIGGLYTEESASALITDYAYTLNELVCNFVLHHGVEEFRYLFSVNKNLIKFACRYKKLYIYGGGEYGAYCIRFLEENCVVIQGVVVSQGMKYSECFLSYPVYEISEIEADEDTGIIIAVSEKGVQAVSAMLQIENFTNCISFSE